MPDVATHAAIPGIGVGYPLWTAAGIVAALVAARLQPDPSSLPPRLRSGLFLCAVGGAVASAYLLQLPADLFGWHAPAPAGMPPELPLGGRTVLGGLLGGWLGVEWAKRRLGIRRPTGDSFALPLALALGFGRLGCMAAGCCAGVVCEPHWWAYVDADGTPRVPVQAAEAVFHFGAAVVLFVAARRRRAGGRRLAAYLAVYAVLRFGLEFVRLQPPMLAGLTWHQLLAAGLFAVAGTTWWRRRSAKPADGSVG